MFILNKVLLLKKMFNCRIKCPFYPAERVFMFKNELTIIFVLMVFLYIFGIIIDD